MKITPDDLAALRSIPKHVGDWLYHKRQAKPATIRELAHELGVTPTFLSDVEHGRIRFDKDLDSLIRFARAYGTTAGELQAAIIAADLHAKEWLAENRHLAKYLRRVRPQDPRDLVLD